MFMFFERYDNEIHIPAFLNLLMENVSFSVPHLRLIILKLYIQNLYIKPKFQKQNGGIPFDSVEQHRFLFSYMQT